MLRKYIHIIKVLQGNLVLDQTKKAILQIIFRLILISKMGNSLKSKMNICCQPREHIHQGDMQSMELTKPKPLIDSDTSELNDLSSNSATIQNKQNQFNNNAATASTTFTNNNCLISLSNLRNIVNINDVSIKIEEPPKKGLDIPFSVIKMTLSKKLIQNLEIYSIHYLQKFQKQNEKFYKWTLTQKGHYISFFNSKTICAFTETIFYEGQFNKTTTNEYIPQNQGLLINQQGIYKGSFIDGRANGKGKFIQGNCLLTYKGEWLDGQFIQGTVENQIIKFAGFMENGLATGDGKLFWKKQEISFSGNFRKGLFQGSNCVLITPNYRYQGGFKAGRKAGKGSITQMQQKIDIKIGSTRVKKYRPSFTIVGLWQCDDLIQVFEQY